MYEDEDDELVLKAFDAEPVSDDIPEPENTHAVSLDGIKKEVTSLAQGYTYSLTTLGTARGWSGSTANTSATSMRPGNGWSGAPEAGSRTLTASSCG